MAKPFREALLERCEQTKTSLKKVAEGTGVSYDQLKKLRQREDAKTNVDDAIKIAAFFGLSMEEFVGDEAVEARVAVVETYNQLTPRERAILRAAGQVDGGSDPEGS